MSRTHANWIPVEIDKAEDGGDGRYATAAVGT